MMITANKHYRIDCQCPRAMLVWTNRTNIGKPTDNVSLRYQCLECGALGSHALPHRFATSETPMLDMVAFSRWLRRAGLDYEFNRQQREIEREKYRLRYRDYLASDKWRDKRQLVLKRAGFVCEGCETNEATEVHHLTYEHVFNELLWELKAVCRDCHRLCHDIEDDDEVAA